MFSNFHDLFTKIFRDISYVENLSSIFIQTKLNIYYIGEAAGNYLNLIMMESKAV